MGWTAAQHKGPKRKYWVFAGPDGERSLTAVGAWRVHNKEELKQQDRINTAAARKKRLRDA